MTITEINVKKFLHDVSVQPEKVNVFIGANGSGKSTIWRPLVY